MKLLYLAALLITPTALLAAEKARNVILFLGDAGGIPTLHAASIHGHNDPQALYIQHMPYLGLVDTSAADRWVTDSAAGMSAIVTGRKTNNGVISEASDAVPQKSDGTALQTILEYAEEQGLSTGVITNTSLADATPAACYAHTHYRKNTVEIMNQLGRPRFGDGPEIVIGLGRKAIYAAMTQAGQDLDRQLRDKGYTVLADPAGISPDTTRAIAIADTEFDPLSVVRTAIETLARNPKGYFLMVEWDMHTTDIRKGLDRVLKMDALVKQTAAQVGPGTLILFTADHSFDLRVRGGKRGEPLLPARDAEAPGEVRTANAFTGEQESESKLPSGQTKTVPVNVRVDNGHTGEQVLAAAQGPGASRVHGFMRNTDLFHVMMSAYGWTPKAAPRE